MSETNGSTEGAGQLPVRVVTVNQVVAWNLGRYRRENGLTQPQLGALIGWTKSSVSDAERSVKGEWTREFSAHELAVIAAHLEVPIGALFLPPDDDGISVRYSTDFPVEDGTERLDMTELLRLVLPDAGQDSPAAEDYRDRLRSEVAARFDEHWKAEIDRILGDADSEALRADLVARYRSRRDRLLAMAAEDDDLADFLEQKGGKQ